MGIRPTQTDKLAPSLLAKQGISAIWKPHEAAAWADRADFPQSATALIEVAEAAAGIDQRDGVTAAWLTCNLP